MRKSRREILLLTGVALAGCTKRNTEENKTEQQNTMAETEVEDLGKVDNETFLKRVVDREAGIVLYITNEESYGGQSMTGFKLEETDI